MTQEKIRLALPLVLPGIPDEQDACVARLLALLDGRPGIERAHLEPATDDSPPLFCLHYDPERLSLGEVEALVKVAGAQVLRRYGHAVLQIRAIASEDAAAGMEADLRRIRGVLAASVSLPAQALRIEWDRNVIDDEGVQSAVNSVVQAGPLAVPGPDSCCGPREPIDNSGGWFRRHRELVWSLGAGLLLLCAWVGQRWLGLPRLPAIGIYAVAYAFGAWDLVSHWVASLRRGQVTFGIDLLMLLAAAGAAVLGEWFEGALLLFLFSLAHALEHYALGRARQAIRALADLAPGLARVRRDGRELEIPVAEVRLGEIVIVYPASAIPVDGSVAVGTSAVNQAPITGESVPVDKVPGDPVFAGTVNGEGVLEITTSKVVGDRTVDRVIKLVEEAQTQKAPTQQFTEKFERIFVPAVLLLDVLVIALPPLLGVWAWDSSFYRGMALLVAASPCALALGTPAAVLAGIAQAARKGVLIKGGAHLENLGTLRALALDKTGTLTTGKPEVTDIVPFDGIAAQELLRVTAAVENRSQHPLARAVVIRAEAERLVLPEASNVQSVTARGVRATVEGKLVEIGALRLWQEQGVTIPPALDAAVARLQARGRSTMVVRSGDRWLGTLGMADRPRPGVREVLAELRRLRIRPLVMLTGDNKGVGDAIGAEVGADEVRADLLPEDKVAAVQELLRQYGQVAMLGDGVNDAPALAHATVGIAMGGAGTAAALETADIALMGDDLGRLPFAVGLSRRARAIIRQNLAIALFIVVLLLVTTIAGVFGIGAAVVLHEGSTLLVIANALRLLSYNGPVTAGRRGKNHR